MSKKLSAAIAAIEAKMRKADSDSDSSNIVLESEKSVAVTPVDSDDSGAPELVD